MKPGESYRIFFSECNVNNKLIHIRAIIDDNQVVFRRWSYTKRRWIYLIQDMIWFDMLANDGFMKKVKW